MPKTKVIVHSVTKSFKLHFFSYIDQCVCVHSGNISRNSMYHHQPIKMWYLCFGSFRNRYTFSSLQHSKCMYIEQFGFCCTIFSLYLSATPWFWCLPFVCVCFFNSNLLNQIIFRFTRECFGSCLLLQMWMGQPQWRKQYSKKKYGTV